MSDPNPKIKGTTKTKEDRYDKNAVYAVQMHLDAQQRVEGYIKFCEERDKAKKAKEKAQGTVATASTAASPALPSLRDFPDLQKFIAEVTGKPCDTEEHFKVYDNERSRLFEILTSAIDRLDNDRVCDLIILLGADLKKWSKKCCMGILEVEIVSPIHYTLVTVTKNRTVTADQISAYDLSRASFIIIDLINADAALDGIDAAKRYSFIHHLVKSATKTFELLPLLSFVLQRNCDINVLDSFGETPLFGIINFIKLDHGYFNPKAVKEVIKLLVKKGRQHYHLDHPTPQQSIFEVVCELLITARDPSIIEGLNFILEDMRRQALEHCDSLIAKEYYRDLESELKDYTFRELATPLDNGLAALSNDYDYIENLFDENIYPSALKTVKQNRAEGFAMARMFLADSQDQYILPVCWRIVKDYLKAAFFDKGYELGWHLALPETTTADELDSIAQSTRIIERSRAYVRCEIEMNEAFESNSSSEGVSKRKAREMVVSPWTVSGVVAGIANSSPSAANSVVAASNCDAVCTDSKTVAETRTRKNNVLCYRYRMVNSSLKMNMNSTITEENDNSVTSFTLEPSQTAATTHTVIRHYQNGVPSPACLIFNMGKLAVALKKDCVDVAYHPKGDKQPFNP